MGQAVIRSNISFEFVVSGAIPLVEREQLTAKYLEIAGYSSVTLLMLCDILVLSLPLDSVLLFIYSSLYLAHVKLIAANIY